MVSLDSSHGTDSRRSIPLGGDRLNFNEFYRLEADGVYRALALALGDSGLAEEATNEGMIRAYQRWRRIRRYDNPAGWVYRVALNWARSRLRKNKREILAQEVDTMGEQAALVGDGIDLEESTQFALAQLSIDYRSVVVLRYLLGWSTAETADALGVAQGTVKSRLARALGQMEETLRQPR